MPEVMMIMSSERVAPARKGRMVSGASVWPMKMLAATLVDSAPEVPMVRCMIQATALMICCMRPMWYMMAKKAETKMMVGRTAKARVASASPGVPMRPKTSEEPSAEWPRRPVMTEEMLLRMRWPRLHLMTRKAKMICRPRPQATVRH